MDGFEGRPESDCAARDGIDHALHYMRCVLAHRKLAKHITKCSGDAGAATPGGHCRTRRPAALLAEARRAHGRRGLGMLCAAASKRLSRRARSAREERSTASVRARRRRRISAASDDAKRHRALGFEPRTKRTALLPGPPGHNATARSSRRSRRSQRCVDAPHESAQESRLQQQHARLPLGASRGRQARDGSN